MVFSGPLFPELGSQPSLSKLSGLAPGHYQNVRCCSSLSICLNKIVSAVSYSPGPGGRGDTPVY